MAYTIEPVSETEFKVNNTFVYKDHNNKWVATPPIEDQQMQKSVNNYIQSLNNG